ncbi:glutathione S-transferase family protein [Paraburkholderia dipogonis]|uniref:Glutathione S-transferase family protein n=1 Tax=Paraburkholderia dipogonis TaxID=1211383 RepID=A0A4Y8MVA4_9BURK|nr:glutathione S-transferase family protein [Paraburkholderia dipogonis]TFE41437.1 glutathione S-transferase family protein [Paraburkholderia dipogonis]
MPRDSTPYVLYYSPGAASMAVHWMLIELGISFESQLIDIDAGRQRDPAYLRLNPAGRVPTLMVDGTPRHESAALLILLAERHPEAALAPEPGSVDRAAWLEMMVYLANTILPAMRDWFYACSDGDPGGAEAVRALACRRLDAAWDKLDAHLGESHDYLIGDKLSTADFMAVMLMRWTRNMPRPALGWPNLARYIRQQRARPSFIELNAREGLTEWRNEEA